MTGAVLVDWGTSNLRAWLVDDAGRILEQTARPFGIAQITPGTAGNVLAREVQAPWNAGALPAILCGMVGSSIGWVDAGYCRAPAGVSDIIGGCVTPVPETFIAPGVCLTAEDGTADVMRGEETQIFGWLYGDAARAGGRHLLCLPGTHSKWVRVDQGQIIDFATMMTGELFDLLRNHSILARGETCPDDAAFAEGVAAGLSGTALSQILFAVRARQLVGKLKPASAQSFLSGILIGAELFAADGRFNPDRTETVHVIAGSGLHTPYLSALAISGRPAVMYDGSVASCDGLNQIRRAYFP